MIAACQARQEQRIVGESALLSRVWCSIYAVVSLVSLVSADFSLGRVLSPLASLTCLSYSFLAATDRLVSVCSAVFTTACALIVCLEFFVTLLASWTPVAGNLDILWFDLGLN